MITISPPISTYLDTCVLLAAIKEGERLHDECWELINSVNRVFLTSTFTKLETLPFCRPEDADERDFLDWYFCNATNIQIDETVIDCALALRRHVKTLGFADVLHAACAVNKNVGEFVTIEKSTKPFRQLNNYVGTLFRSLTNAGQLL